MSCFKNKFYINPSAKHLSQSGCNEFSIKVVLFSDHFCQYLPCWELRDPKVKILGDSIKTLLLVNSA